MNINYMAMANILVYVLIAGFFLLLHEGIVIYVEKSVMITRNLEEMEEKIEEYGGGNTGKNIIQNIRILSRGIISKDV